MSFLPVVVLLLFACEISSAAQCPRVDSQPDFNTTLYAGVWYEVNRHDINQIGYKCDNETFLANPNGTMSVQLQGYTQSAYYNKQGLAKAEKEIDPASFIIHFPGSLNTIKYNIIKTDYNRYSLIYSCDYVPGLDINFQHIWILSRNKTLDAEIVTELEDMLKKEHVRTDDIESDPQNC